MVQEITSSAELASLFSSHTYVLLDFYADWCGPCKQIAPFVQSLEEKHAVPGHFAIAKVNTDTARDVAAEYRISAMPTFLFFKEGKAVAVHGQAMIQGANPPALAKAAEKLGGLAKKRQEEAQA